MLLKMILIDHIDIIIQMITAIKRVYTQTILVLPHILIKIIKMVFIKLFRGSFSI